MSSVSSEGLGGSGKGGTQDFELNLASIIDCMTVLITFLLASASFLSIGILDAGIAAGGKDASPSTPPPITITVELASASMLNIKVAGKLTQTIPLTAAAGAWNFDGLTEQLAALKAKFPEVTAVTVNAADENVEYKDVVKAMEVARRTLPAVMLGGF
jgi:biopolymer transport protein ExbD